MEAGIVEYNRNLSITELTKNKDIILGAIKNAMEKDKDYGVIPGTKKSTLYKPGAEKLLMMFRLCAEPHVQDLSTIDEARYRVETKIVHAPSGIVLGHGVGEASSNEEKYKWRKASCQEEYDETPEDRRRGKWSPVYSKGQKVWDKQHGCYVMEKVLQIRTNHADLANTILKMADKRSLVGGTLKVTAASAVFTQDLEDLSEELRDVIVEAEDEPQDPEKNPIAAPQRATESNIEMGGPPAGAEPSGGRKADPKWKRMEAKKDGRCSNCQEPIKTGQPIYFDKDKWEAHHEHHYA